ncbi:Cro/CI family transcriptional regulator [Burkholderia glumae]
MTLTKEQAVGIFGTQAELARALGISRSAVSQWGDSLDQQRTDMVIGAAVRVGRPVPNGFIADDSTSAVAA